jgi:hypothetical protein
MTLLFEEFYAGKVAEQLKINYIENVRVDMHVSKIEPCTVSGLQKLWMTWPKT